MSDIEFVRKAIKKPWLFWLCFWRIPRYLETMVEEIERVQIEEAKFLQEHSRIMCELEESTKTNAQLLQERSVIIQKRDESIKANTKLLKWVHVTHRLSTTPEAIRALFAAGKRLSTLLLFLALTLSANAQLPPILRNQWTTNADPRAIKVISTNGVQAATNVWGLDFTNTATVTVGAVSNAGKVMVSFESSGSSGSSNMTNALLHAGPTNGSVGAQVLTAGNNISLETVNDTNREINVVGVIRNTNGFGTNATLVSSKSIETTNLIFRSADASGGRITNLLSLSLISQGLQPLVSGMAVGESTNNWSAGNDPSSPYRLTPDRYFTWGLNNPNLPSFTPGQLYMFFGLESTWFNPGLPPVAEFYFRTALTNSEGTALTPEPWGGFINLVSGSVTHAIRGETINFDSDNGSHSAVLSHDGTNSGTFNFNNAALAFIGLTNAWSIRNAVNLGVLGKPLGNTNLLFEGQSNDRLLLFSPNNASHAMWLGFGSHSNARWIGWNGTNTPARWELQNLAGDYLEIATERFATYSRSTNILQYVALGQNAGDYRTLGYVTNAESHGFLLEVSLFGESTSQKYIWGNTYGDQTATWKEVLPIVNAVRSATEGRIALDVRTVTNRHELRLRRIITDSQGGNFGGVVMMNADLGARWVKDVTGSGTNATADGGIFRHTALTAVLGKVGINTNNPSESFHVQGTSLFNGTVAVSSVATGSVLRLDSDKIVRALTIGSGLSFDGTTLSAPGSGGSGIATTNGTGWNTTFVTQTNHSQIVFTNNSKIGATATNTLTVSNSHVRFTPDNSWDLGASMATRPRVGYFGTRVDIGDQASPIVAPLQIQVNGSGIGFVIAQSATEYTDFISGGVLKGIRGRGTVDFVVQNEGKLLIRTGAGDNDRWEVSSAGHFLASTDSTYDIGASGATRPRSGYFGTLVRSPKFETAASVQWTSGSGSPEGAVTANVGSLYTRTDGGAGTTLYVKESGTGNTGWVAK